MLEQLIAVVKDVGDLLMDWRQAGIIEGIWHGNQVKAKVDGMAHNAFERLLKNLWPQIPVISEEDPDTWLNVRPARYWLIDPIDGTASFVKGYPGFVTQVALMENGAPVMAVVLAPVLNLLYVAEKCKGASLNGVKLIVQNGFPAEKLIDNFPAPRGIALSAFTELGFRKYIESGSISLKICRVADGTADLFFKTVVVKDWDLAAPHLVIAEMGGYLSDIHGQPFTYKGAFERVGLIAASQENTFRLFLDWYSKMQERS